MISAVHTHHSLGGITTLIWCCCCCHCYCVCPVRHSLLSNCHFLLTNRRWRRWVKSNHIIETKIEIETNEWKFLFGTCISFAHWQLFIVIAPFLPSLCVYVFNVCHVIICLMFKMYSQIVRQWLLRTRRRRNARKRRKASALCEWYGNKYD